MLEIAEDQNCRIKLAFSVVVAQRQPNIPTEQTNEDRSQKDSGVSGTLIVAQRDKGSLGWPAGTNSSHLSLTCGDYYSTLLRFANFPIQDLHYDKSETLIFTLA